MSVDKNDIVLYSLLKYYCDNESICFDELSNYMFDNEITKKNIDEYDNFNELYLIIMNKLKNKKQNTKNSIKINGFNNIKYLNKGGYSKVYTAFHNVDNKKYAIKKIKYSEQSQNEINIMSDFDHINIVKYNNSWINDKYLYIQMKLYETTLREWIDNRNFKSDVINIPRDDEKRIIKQIIDGVKYIHSFNIYHNDLKPGNIFLDKNMTVKIGDFGLSKVNESNNEGTLLYMIPYNPTIPKNVDYYSIGVIYYELCTKFSTESERIYCLQDLKKKMITDSFNGDKLMLISYIDQI